MKNIGVIVDNEFYTDVRVVNECKILAQSGLHVFVLCFDYGTAKPMHIYENITVISIKINRARKNLLFAFNNSFGFYTRFWKKQIKKFVKEFDITALHVHDLYMSKAAYLGTKTMNISFNLDLHENYPAAVKGYKWMFKFPQRFFIKPLKYKKIEKKYLGYPQNIIVLSESFRDDLLRQYKYLKKDQFVIYPNVPDINEFENYIVDENILNKDDSFVLFYFGGISERRGVYTAIEAIKILKDKIPNLKLLLIGPVDKAEEGEFINTINKSEFKNHIIYYKWKDISLLPSYIFASDICLSPIFKNDQHESGIANKVFQYMLFERPLIVSNCKPQKILVEQEECGLSFESENAEDLSDKVLELYHSVTHRKMMGANGKRAILEKYNTQKIGRNLVNLYQE